MSSLVATLSCALLSACGGGGGAPAGSGGGVASALASNVASPSDAKAQPLVASAKPANLVIRAYGSQAGGIGPMMVVRVNGVVVGSVEVRATEPTDYPFPATGLSAGAIVDVVFTNDEAIGSQDRNLFVSFIADGVQFMSPSESGVIYDAGAGPAAFDGANTGAGQQSMWFAGALRFTWPAVDRFTVSARDAQSSRFLQQATFGTTPADLQRLRTQTFTQWIEQQQALPVTSDYFVSYIQSKFDQSADNLPITGSKYNPDWVGQRFWAGAATGDDQLRRRMAFALHKIFVVSQTDPNLYWQARAYAAYLDGLHRLAFGNFRALLEEVALSPAMGIYLSHMRNEKEDLVLNRLPDENFARELMQLFSIGLHELNNDGTPKLDPLGRPIESYSNNDVMAMAKVFTGWSWGYDDAQLTGANFRWGNPEARTTTQARVDIRRMKPYPLMSSTAEKRLFSGKPNALVIPANTAPAESVKLALDTLFNHPNVGPFLARQLIQQFVTSNPSPAYVNRVANVFNDNGRSVRGDLAAVVRAVLLDNEARAAPGDTSNGKVREPILRVTQWMRAFEATSLSAQYQITEELTDLGQRPNRMPSVFSYFRPGYAPGAGALAMAGLGAPEMQIVDESSVAAWPNALEVMLREGLGWSGAARDVTVALASEGALAATAPQALLKRLDELLFAGQMSFDLKVAILGAMQGVPEWTENRHLVATRVAVFVAMTSPEYLVQR